MGLWSHQHEQRKGGEVVTEHVWLGKEQIKWAERILSNKRQRLRPKHLSVEGEEDAERFGGHY